MPDDLNPAPDLAPFADALKRLAPQPPHLSRDALLFAAGKAAGAPRLAPWVWPTATGTFAALSLVLFAFVVSPAPQPAVVYVERPVAVAPPAPELAPEPPASPPAPPAVVRKDDRFDQEARETARLLQQRRDVLRWGIDMLPEPKAGGAGSFADDNAREVTRWLNLPAGTFAIPAAVPPEPKPRSEDEE